MFENSPIVASPTYDRCGTFVPSPIDAFFVSTYVPILPLRPNRVPGRKYANGPTDASGPTSASTDTVLSTRAPAPTRVSVKRVFGPTSQHSATCVEQCNCVPSPIDAFFVSTYVPILPLRPNRVPGRKYANGPTDASGPTSASTDTVLSTRAPAPTRVSVKRVFGPTSQPSAKCVEPCNCVP